MLTVIRLPPPSMYFNAWCLAGRVFLVSIQSIIEKYVILFGYSSLFLLRLLLTSLTLATRTSEHISST